MRKLTPKILIAVLGSGLGIGLLGGCEVNHHTHYAAAAYVEPGWYYDREYYEPGGRYHNRVYYYYDGHHWDRRDRVPEGIAARERHLEHAEHEEHMAHLEHDYH